MSPQYPPHDMDLISPSGPKNDVHATTPRRSSCGSHSRRRCQLCAPALELLVDGLCDQNLPKSSFFSHASYLQYSSAMLGLGA
jgi:hypothetical protein